MTANPSDSCCRRSDDLTISKDRRLSGAKHSDCWLIIIRILCPKYFSTAYMRPDTLDIYKNKRS